ICTIGLNCGTCIQSLCFIEDSACSLDVYLPLVEPCASKHPSDLRARGLMSFGCQRTSASANAIDRCVNDKLLGTMRSKRGWPSIDRYLKPLPMCACQLHEGGRRICRLSRDSRFRYVTRSYRMSRLYRSARPDESLC